MSFYSAGEWSTTYDVLNTTISRAPKIVSFAASADWEQLLYWYSIADALEKAIWLMLVVAFVCWLLSIITWNFSQVDRMWSIIPCVYVWLFALHAPLSPRGGHWYNSRLIIMGILSTLWGIRLSLNFYRKGGYSCKEEDYRWPILRTKMNIVVWHLFNIFFIALYQHVLLLLITLPAYVALLASQKARHSGLLEEPDLTLVDYVAIASFVLLLIGEIIADEQQWNFHKEKRKFQKKKLNNDKVAASAPSTIQKKQANKKKPQKTVGTVSAFLRKQCEDGFLQSGLFTFSRHPNYFCEISLWWAFYLFSVAASGVWINWSVLGTVLLTLLIHGSTDYTEFLSLQKYPEYASYQQTTSRLIPWFRSKPTSPKKKK